MPESFSSHAPHLLPSFELQLHFQSSGVTTLVLHNWLYLPLFHPQTHMRTNFVVYHVYPMNSMKRQKDRTLKDELHRSVRAQYATGAQWRNNSRKNEETEPKLKQHPAVDVTGDRSKV